MKSPAGWSDMPDAYYDESIKAPIHSIYGLLEPHLPKGGIAVELGCGVGHGVGFFLERGFKVFALDFDPRSIHIVSERFANNEALTLVQGDMRTTDWPRADVVVAGFSLFIVPPEDFTSVWSKVQFSLSSGRLFAGQFLGIRDDWQEPELTRHDAPGLREIFEDFELLSWEEVEIDGKTRLDSPKHWHIFHVVARKR